MYTVRTVDVSNKCTKYSRCYESTQYSSYVHFTQ